MIFMTRVTTMPTEPLGFNGYSFTFRYAGKAPYYTHSHLYLQVLQFTTESSQTLVLERFTSWMAKATVKVKI